MQSTKFLTEKLWKKQQELTSQLMFTYSEKFKPTGHFLRNADKRSPMEVTQYSTHALQQHYVQCSCLQQKFISLSLRELPVRQTPQPP